MLDTLARTDPQQLQRPAPSQLLDNGDGGEDMPAGAAAGDDEAQRWGHARGGRLGSHAPECSSHDVYFPVGTIRVKTARSNPSTARQPSMPQRARRRSSAPSPSPARSSSTRSVSTSCSKGS